MSVTICISCLVEDINPQWIIPILALFALLVSTVGFFVSLAGYHVNAKPVLVFVYDAKKHMYQITNAGKAPALNLTVVYSISAKDIKWINPVKCYSLKAGDTLDLDWLISSDRSTLIEKTLDEDIIRKIFLEGEEIWVSAGMGSYGVIYYSAFPLPFFSNTYTSVMHDDNTKRYEHNALGEKEIKNPKRIWELVTKKDRDWYSSVG